MNRKEENIILSEIYIKKKFTKINKEENKINYITRFPIYLFKSKNNFKIIKNYL